MSPRSHHLTDLFTYIMQSTRLFAKLAPYTTCAQSGDIRTWALEPSTNMRAETGQLKVPLRRWETTSAYS